MGDIRVVEYDPSLEGKWDRFVLEASYNGTFLQTRRFLGYHPEGRFREHSLMIYKGSSDILAVVPGCICEAEGMRKFVSHPGSTFGGLVINEAFYDLDDVEGSLEAFEEYLQAQRFDEAILKQSSRIFCSKPNDLLEYLYFNHGWTASDELSFVIDYDEYDDEVIANFTSSRRRGYRKGEKSGLRFCKLTTDEEIASFYEVLCINLRKFNATPVHTLDELFDLYHHRLADVLEFYGVYCDGVLAAGSMVFKFSKRVFHTQYLASLSEFNSLFPSNYMDGRMIALARDEGFEYFSFGISTEDHGRTLNHDLAKFKEGFGTSYCNNRTFHKSLGLKS